MVDFLFVWNSVLFIVLVSMYAFTWLNVSIYEDLDKFKLFLFYEKVQECIVSARCALIESISTHKLRRDNVKLMCARSA